MKVSWIIGPKEPIGTDDKKKGFVPRTGKNGGPIFKQEIVKVFSPK